MLGSFSAAVAALAVAAPAVSAAPPRVEIRSVRLAAPSSATPRAAGALLVSVRYPRHMKAHAAPLEIALLDRGRVAARTRVRPVLSAGLPRETADARDGFTFVQRVPLRGRTARSLLARGGQLDVRVRATAVLDADSDGRAEARSIDVERHRVRPESGARAAGRRVLCSSTPLVYARTRRVWTFDLPQCTVPMRWSFARRPRHGKVRHAAGAVSYFSDRGMRGADGFVLRGRPIRRARDAAKRPGAAAAAAATSADVLVPVALQVGDGSAPTTSVRAIGDSVTAGFGYYDDGSAMTIEGLIDCRPGDSLYDACSSNSLTTSNDGPLTYAPDYGLSNQIAWPARWASSNGITNFANYAVTGSAPGDWAPGGQFYAQTRAAESAAPDYLVFTLGANPLLSDVLFGIDNMGCALWSDLSGDFTTCVLNAFRSVGLQANLARLYADLLANTPASTQLLAMQYHLAVPSIALAYSSAQIERMSDLLNQTIAQLAAATRSPRLRVIAPPRFDVGIDLSPQYPSRYSCLSGGFVDGPSVQSSATQWEFQHDPLGGPFCPGPDIGDPWIISADTGIHPSVTGHRMMAASLPTP